ncbi:MAG: ATP-binding cassette domain-containing protein [Magnetococcales bacterium]|nr:ATP-binding cassette domain-containing protein [Magnetococcales bacterium]
MKRLWQRLAARPLLLFELLLASFFTHVLGLASSIYVMLVLGRYISHGLDATLFTLCSGVLIAIALEAAFRGARFKLAAVFAGQELELNAAGFSILAQAQFQHLDRIPPELRMELAGSAREAHQPFQPHHLTALLDLPFALVYVIALWFLSPSLALSACLAMAACLGLGAWQLRRLGGLSTRAMGLAAKRRELLSTAVFGAQDLRLFRAGGVLQRAWNQLNAQLSTVELKLTQETGAARTLTGTIAALMGVAVITLGAVMVVQGQLTVGVLIGANILAARALGPLAQFVGLSETVSKAEAARAKLEQFLRLPLEAAGGTVIKNLAGRLEFKEVAFSFPGARMPLFEGVSFVLQPGAALGVVGPNGSGKTTFARMTAGLVDPVRGQILVDGVELRQLNPGWWRGQLIHLPQEPLFLNGSIRENLQAANPEADEATLEEAVRLAGLSAFLDATANGLETLVENNGRTLSPGVRRRLALARGLMTGGKIVLLDEPFEGLDGEGQTAVQEVIAALRARGATVILLSHDRNALRGVNAVLDLGRKPVPALMLPQRPGESAPPSAAAGSREGGPVHG